MKSSNVKKAIILVIVVVLVFGIIFGIMALTQNLGKSQEVITQEDASERLTRLYNGITVETKDPVKSSVDLTETDTSDELPSIDKYPLSVKNSTDTYIEIFSSPEKAGEGTDAWLNEIAKKFNNEKFVIDGKEVSVAIRNIASGLGTDYITSGKYTPDAFSPSNTFWGEMVAADNIKIELVEKRLAGNVAGVLLSNDKYKELIDKYGSINMKTITSATESGEFAMGYTNPFASSTGLNFLLSTLYTYNPKDFLSDEAIAGFNKFQENIPFVSYTTMQMRDAAASGELDGFVLEYQSYYNLPDIQREYKFTPFGTRHDNPLYAIGNLSNTKQEILEKFAEYCLSDNSQKLASEYGFNQKDDYVSEMPEFKGNDIINAQKLYKKNKNLGKPIVAVFVSDVSGSMNGEPLNNLKNSLINSMKYINSDNYVGLVSYSNNVSIDVPIEKFDLNQKSLFKGAVETLEASGNTATFDAIVVAIDMLNKAKETYPDCKPMLFVLSDGEQNMGCSLNDISPILEAYKIPVYTIGYNANIDALQRISSINEAATINADSDDITYQLKNLFNSEM